MGRFCQEHKLFLQIVKKNVVEAAGVEPASLAKLPAATTCLVRREFSTGRLRPDTESHSLARRIRVSASRAQTPRLT